MGMWWPVFVRHNPFDKLRACVSRLCRGKRRARATADRTEELLKAGPNEIEEATSHGASEPKVEMRLCVVLGVKSGLLAEMVTESVTIKQ